MNDSIWQTIAGTSWWVYFVCIALVYVSYQASKPRIIKLHLLLVVTAYFICLSIIGMYAFVQLNALNIACWFVMFLLGSGCGWLQLCTTRAKAITGHRKLLLPGSWTTMFVIILLMAGRYYLRTEIHLDASIIQTAKFHFFAMAGYGFFTGFFLGRICCVLRVIKVGPFTTMPQLAH